MTDRTIPYCMDCNVKMEAKRLRGYIYLCTCPVCKRQVRVEREAK